MRIRFLSFLLLCAGSWTLSLSAQEITTASDLFKVLSENYEGMQDYTARINIAYNDETMSGTLTYKAPQFFRIDFTDPAKQAFVSDGKILSVYLPRYAVTYTQELHKPGTETPAALATAQGLKLMRASYSINYLNGPGMEALEEGSSEQVYALKLTSASELYRQIVLSIVPTSGGKYLIRRLKGTTVSNRTIQIDFRDIQSNLGVPDSKFQFDAPPNSNVVRNFLFDPEG